MCSSHDTRPATCEEGDAERARTLRYADRLEAVAAGDRVPGGVAKPIPTLESGVGTIVRTSIETAERSPERADDE